MIRSMTGFGCATRDERGRRVSVEVRSLNSKYYKAQVRVPEELQALEAELESALSHKLGRGSVVMNVRFADASASAAGTINVAAVESYLRQLQGVAGVDHAMARIDLGTLLSLPGVLVEDGTAAHLDELRPVLAELLDEAVAGLIAMREREGDLILGELHAHCRVIADHLDVIVAHVPSLIDAYQQKLRARMESLLSSSGTEVREEDLLREVAVFAEKSDIAEEVARLQGHLGQFRELVDATPAKSIGRTLDFVAQEMLREANTIASKCLDVDVARRIVEIKGSIDRIKEQVQNVE